MKPKYPNVAKLGFKRDMSKDAPICRWRLGNLEVDLMPTDTNILGFANRWYPLAVQTAQLVTLGNGATIRLIAAPVFLATKFEAFANRGKGDLLGSHDLEDIVNVLDGRPEIVGEIDLSKMELRRYLADRCGALLAMPNLWMPCRVWYSRMSHSPGECNCWQRDSGKLRNSMVDEA